MEYIYWEIPSWAINWINKEYTLLYNIDRIEEIYIWWASYRSFSFIWNVITLTDAPPTWTTIYVDYFKEDLTPLSPTGDVTLWDVINDVYDKIGQVRANNKVYKESQIKLAINAWIKRIANLRTYKNDILQYSFNKAKELSVIWYNASYLNIWEDKLYIPASWIAILKDNIIVNYSSYTDWKLMWVAWITYTNWDFVSIWYKIPSWVKKISEISIWWTPLEYIDVREFSLNYKYYSIIKIANWDEYIILPITKNEDIITVKYQPNYSNYSDDDDVVNIEYEYFEVLSYYALYSVFQMREDDRWQYAEKEYNKLLREYKSYKSKAVDWINNKLKSNILSQY